MGNFLGDFVKGSELGKYPEHIQLGVLLHRKLDVFTDQHVLVKTMLTEFPADIRRMAGIALDIYFDHLLLHRWEEFTTSDYEALLNSFYTELDDFEQSVTPRFSRVRQGLLAKRWLASYADEDTCFEAFRVMEQRMRRPIPFAATAKTHILLNREQITGGFREFYPDLLRFAAQLAPQLRHTITTQD